MQKSATRRIEFAYIPHGTVGGHEGCGRIDRRITTSKSESAHGNGDLLIILEKLLVSGGPDYVSDPLDPFSGFCNNHDTLQEAA